MTYAVATTSERDRTDKSDHCACARMRDMRLDESWTGRICGTTTAAQSLYVTIGKAIWPACFTSNRLLALRVSCMFIDHWLRSIKLVEVPSGYTVTYQNIFFSIQGNAMSAVGMTHQKYFIICERTSLTITILKS